MWSSMKINLNCVCVFMVIKGLKLMCLKQFLDKKCSSIAQKNKDILSFRYTENTSRITVWFGISLGFVDYKKHAQNHQTYPLISFRKLKLSVSFECQPALLFLLFFDHYYWM